MDAAAARPRGHQGRHLGGRPDHGAGGAARSPTACTCIPCIRCTTSGTACCPAWPRRGAGRARSRDDRQDHPGHRRGGRHAGRAGDADQGSQDDASPSMAPRRTTPSSSTTSATSACATSCATASRRGDSARSEALITDEILDQFAIVARWDDRRRPHDRALQGHRRAAGDLPRLALARRSIEDPRTLGEVARARCARRGRSSADRARANSAGISGATSKCVSRRQAVLPMRVARPQHALVFGELRRGERSRGLSGRMIAAWVSGGTSTP